MEYLDVLDEKGNPTGLRKLKTEVHRDGDWHKSVHLWIVNSKGELLLQKRAHIKDSYPDMWDISSAGHISAGEDVPTSLARELKEELGLQASKDEFEYLFSVRQQAILDGGSYVNNEFNDVYLLKRDVDASEFTLQKEEVAEVKWMSLGEFEILLKSGGSSLVSHPEEYGLLLKEIRRRYA